MKAERIGIMGAMRPEIALLLSDMTQVQKAIRGGRSDIPGVEQVYYNGSLYGREVTLAFSGWGKVASASTATTLLESFDADVLIFTGVAGALDHELNIGDVVVGDDLIQHDMDASALETLSPFEVPIDYPGLKVKHFVAQPEIVRLAKKVAKKFLHDGLSEVSSRELSEFGISTPKVDVGLIATGDHFIADSFQAAKLRDLGAKCAEMEGAAVAQVCWQRNIPLAVLRVISDKADHSAVIDFPRFVNQVASLFTRGVIRDLIPQI